MDKFYYKRRRVEQNRSTIFVCLALVIRIVATSLYIIFSQRATMTIIMAINEKSRIYCVYIIAQSLAPKYRE